MFTVKSYKVDDVTTKPDENQIEYLKNQEKMLNLETKRILRKPRKGTWIVKLERINISQFK